MQFNIDPNAKILDLQNRRLNDADIKRLMLEIATNTTLTALNLYNNNIRYDGAKALASNTTLTTLELGYNNIGPEGAKALAANTTLTSLSLRRKNSIGREGVKALAVNTTLTALDLSRNNIGDEGAKALVTNTTLTKLELWGSNLGSEIRRDIDQRLQENQRLQRERRDRVTALLFLLKKEGQWRGWDVSLSFWYQLPKDIRSIILPYLYQEWSKQKIGKFPEEIRQKYSKLTIN